MIPVGREPAALLKADTIQCVADEEGASVRTFERGGVPVRVLCHDDPGGQARANEFFDGRLRAREQELFERLF